MTAPTVPVTVKLADFGGPALAGVKITARASGIDYTADGTFVGTEPVVAVTDANGIAVLNVFPNAVAPVGLGALGTTIRFTASLKGSRGLDVQAVIPNAPCNLVGHVVDQEPNGLGASEIAAAAAQAARDESFVAAASTHADVVATAADRAQTLVDRAATGQDRVATGQDRIATAADRVQTGVDLAAANAAAANANTAAAIAATGAKFFDTIALGRAGVADTFTFGVKAGGSDGLLRPSVYRRDSAGTQTLLFTVLPASDFDAVAGTSTETELLHEFRDNAGLRYAAFNKNAGLLLAGLNGLTLQEHLALIAALVSKDTDPMLHVFRDANQTPYAGFDAGGSLYVPKLGMSVQGEIASIKSRFASINASTDGGYAATVKAEGAVGDFVASDAAAIQRAIDKVAALPYGGTVFFEPGAYLLEAELVPKSNVNLFAHPGTVYLYPQGLKSGFKKIGSAANYLENAHWYGLGIDGSLQAGAYASSIKGAFIQWFRRCVFERLHMRNTAASSLGIDFAVNSAIVNNLIENAGRLNDGTQPGGSGIGIGTGGNLDEPLVIANNICLGAKRFGIFVEKQTGADTPNDSRQTIISGNVCAGNLDGIGDAGVDGLLTIGNQLVANTNNGFTANFGTLDVKPGKNGAAVGNVCAYNGTNGMYIDHGPLAGPTEGGYTLEGNKCYGNTSYGIRARSTSGYNGLRMANNDVCRNGIDGVLVDGGGAFKNLRILGNSTQQNGTIAAASAGIRIATPVNGGRIHGNGSSDYGTSRTIYPDTANIKQEFGLVLAATLTAVDIAENDLTSNKTAAVSITGALTNCTVGRNPGWTVASGSPAGVVPAPVGTTFQRTDGGAGTTFYVKESGGTTTAGWAAK